MSSGRGMHPLRQWARYTCGILGAVLLTAAVSDPPITGPVLSALASPPSSSRLPPGRTDSLSDFQLPHKPQTGRIAPEPKSATALTLQMVDQSAKRSVLPLAPRAMIDRSPVYGTGEMSA